VKTGHFALETNVEDKCVGNSAVAHATVTLAKASLPPRAVHFVEQPIDIRG
jgi:hypothetical protein